MTPDYLPAPGAPAPIAAALLPLDPLIRYVAVNQSGRITEMTQRIASFNPPGTDQLEELVVNPAVLDLARRRGNLDLGGAPWVLIRYGLQFQLLVPYGAGHVSIGLELKADPVRIATLVTERLTQIGAGAAGSAARG
jgi:hypothetical protein